MSVRKSVPCEFEVTKDIYWDDWGRFVKVFRKGEICQGLLRPDGSVSAESTIFDGVSDEVDLDCIKIIDTNDEQGNEPPSQLEQDQRCHMREYFDFY